MADTTCGSLLRELQHIWDEIGEDDMARDRMLLQLEQECLEVYRRKVDKASQARAQLHQGLANVQRDVSLLISTLGDHRLVSEWLEKPEGTLKEQLNAIQPRLDELLKRKEERLKQFVDIRTKMEAIHGEISGSLQPGSSFSYIAFDEKDLSPKRLEEYNSQLEALQSEKKERLDRLSESLHLVHDLCTVMGMDFSNAVSEVHPSLDGSSANQSKSISNDTLERLARLVMLLQDGKKQRMQQLQDLGASLIELWNLMDTPYEEQDQFKHITILIGLSEEEITDEGALALNIIEQAEMEVGRLDQLKASKVKEIVLKKLAELNEIYQVAHMKPDPNVSETKIMAVIESGAYDPSGLLVSIDNTIMQAKEEAQSRKEIMDKLERWISSCEEENWLEQYDKDGNRYSASRGAHINLKRAEKARSTVMKLPALVDSLILKTKSWEEEHGLHFLYDGVRLLEMLDEYKLLRQEKEDEKRRFRDQKRVQEQMQTEQETFFGTRPSPNKSVSARKGLSVRANSNTPSANRRLSLGGAFLQMGAGDVLIPRVNGVTPNRSHKESGRKARPTVPLNYVALGKEDSILSFTASEPTSPMPL